MTLQFIIPSIVVQKFNNFPQTSNLNQSMIEKQMISNHNFSIIELLFQLKMCSRNQVKQNETLTI